MSNFISIHRLRLGEDEADKMANPDNLVEDEEICLTKDMLSDVAETKIGGRK